MRLGFASAARGLFCVVLFCGGVHAFWEKVYTANIDLDRLPVLEHHGKVYMATYTGLINSADTKTWDLTKPVYGGVVSQMLSSGDTLWAATRDKGIQITTDDAGTWKPMNMGLDKTDARGLIRAQNVFFAATMGGGIYRSRDDGKSWQAVNTGLPELQLNCVAAVGNFIFAGTSTKGVYRSADQGDHWVAANNGYPGKGSFLFATDGKVLFTVPIDHKAVNHSPDQGVTWNNDTTGMGVLQFPHTLGDYGTNVYWVHDRNVNGGVHVTTDGGKTWSNLNLDLAHRIERPKAAGFGLGYMIVGSANYGIWRRPISEVNLGPGPDTRAQTLPAARRLPLLRARDGALEYLASDGGRLRLSLYRPDGVLLNRTEAVAAPGLNRWQLDRPLPAGAIFYRFDWEGAGAAQTGRLARP